MTLRIALAVGLLLLSAAPASAATVEVVKTGQVTDRAGVYDLVAFALRAEPGEVNRVTVEPGASPAEVVVRDAGAPLRPGSGCAPAGDAVRCAIRGSVSGARIELGNGNDEARVGGLPFAFVAGDAGDDLISGTASTSLTMDGGPGADRMDARAGEVDYRGRSAPVAVTVGTGPDDGEPGEGDDVGPRVDRVRTGSGDDRVVAGPAPLTVAFTGAGADVLIGSAGSDSLDGGEGADRLEGLGGDDGLEGGPGGDVLRGGPGTDSTSYAQRKAPVSATLDDVRDDGEAGEGDDLGSDIEIVRGGEGADRLVGSAGANRLDGGDGVDVVDGGAGDDLLTEASFYTADRLVGGPGRDTVEVGAFGRARVDLADGEADTLRCGTGLRAPLTADAGLDRADACAPPVGIGSRALRTTADGRARIGLTCFGVGQSCRGTVRVRSRTRGIGTVGAASFSIGAGRTRSLRVAVRPAARRRLRGGRKVRVTVSVESRRATGPVSPVRTARVLTLSR